MTISVALLGRVEVRRNDAPVVIPAGRTTQLLARLALDAGGSVSADRLIADLWPADGRPVQRNTLQSKVSQLRRAIGSESAVTVDAAGYRLDADRSAVDVLRVFDAAEQLAELRAEPAAHVVQVCTSILEMSVEELVPGVDDAWLEPHRARLRQIRIDLETARLTAALDLGRAAELIGDLRSLVSTEPLREGLWALLMIALYRAGRQSDALAAYAEIRRLLDTELGVAPGPELRALHGRVLRQDPALDRPVAPLATYDSLTAGNLPGLTSALIGRATEQAALTELLGQHRLITVVGTAGVGKTRVAIEVARGSAVSGGAWLVRLDNADGPRSIAEALAEVLSIPIGAVTATAGASSAPGVTVLADGALRERLRGAGALLLLDNCEHLVDDVAELVSRLSTVAPDLRILATSQLPLGLDGETVFPLEPLEPDAAIALFSERALARRPAFVLDSDTENAVALLVRSLDGLPLAIELAAARTKALSVQEISRRIEDRFALLADPSSRGPQRHRTLRSAIGWSYELLFPDDQRGLWALSCFTDGAPLTAAESVMGALGVPDAAAIDVIARLVDRSLARVDIGAAGAVRYRLLDSVRAFAAEQLSRAGATEVALGAHARWIAGAATRAATGCRTAAQAAHLAVVRGERGNIDGALTWCSTHDPVLGLRIANGFGWSWVVLGEGIAGARRIRTALASAGTASAADRTTGLLLAGWLEASAGNLVQAGADIEAAELIAEPEQRPLVRLYRAFVLISGGRPAPALTEIEACRPAFRSTDQRWEEGGSWLLSAYAELAVGRLAAGADACRQALTLLVPIGDDWGLAHAEAMLGGLARSEQRYRDAVAHYRRAATSAAALGFAGAEAYHLSNLGRAEHLAGELTTAAAVLAEAEVKGLAAGDFRLVAETRVRQARLSRELGADEMARSAVNAAASWYREFGGGEGALSAEVVLLAIELADAGDAADAADSERRLIAVQASATAAGDTEAEVLALDALARRADSRGDHARAAELLRQSDELAASSPHLVAERDRVDARFLREGPMSLSGGPRP